MFIVALTHMHTHMIWLKIPTDLHEEKQSFLKATQVGTNDGFAEHVDKNVTG